MAIAALCRHRTTAHLLRAIIHKTNVYDEDIFTDEQTFLDRVLTIKPPVALLTSEYIDQPGFFAEIRQCSPITRIVLCALPDGFKSSELWPLLDGLDVYAFCTLSELNDCLSTISLGHFYTSSLLATHPAYLQFEPLPGWSNLTASERGILKLMAEGNNGPQIAQALYISPKTVENHKYKISQKLNVTGGPGSLVKFSLINREKLLSISDEVYKK